MSTPMKNPFAINEFTYWIAQDAMRDILLMYWDMGSSWGEFGHAIETGRFNQYLFLNSFIEDEGYASSVDVPLLHRGSAVKILCYLYDHLTEHEAPPVPGGWFHTRLTELLANGELDHLPLAKHAISSGLQKKSDFDEQLKAVYQDYVIKWLVVNWKIT